jgi:hypothetical protein
MQMGLLLSGHDVLSVTDDSVHHKGLFFAFDADFPNPIEHEAITEVTLRALVDQDAA